MATSPQASYSLILLRNQSNIHSSNEHKVIGSRAIITRRVIKNGGRNFGGVVAAAAKGPWRRERAPPGVDTRIHWDNPDEGWLGGSSRTGKTSPLNEEDEKEEEEKNLLGQNFADLLNDASGSHYQFLGVAADADIEEIKAAYRRLSKEYHPDTTTLPLESASEKFMKLREIYYVLSNEEKRKFYDWTLAQETASRQVERMRKKLEDPFQQDVQNYESVPDMVDRLGGENMELSDQAMSALTIDFFVILFAIGCIIYVLYFKESY